MNNPVYHLRPNKAVDRNLFVEGLIRLGRMMDISGYRYIGFGSYEFDEFKLVYRALGIEDLHSIEMDSDVFRRQKFNKPYSFIKLYNKKCGNYFDEDFDGTKQSIVWVDFSVANEKYSQCQDIANICSKMKDRDILRITFNANPTGITTGGVQASIYPPEERKRIRYDALRKELKEFFPDGFAEDDLTKNRYPLLLLRTIRKAVFQNLDVDLYPCPLCSYVYSDNTQMMTVTLLMCSVKNRDNTMKDIRDSFKDWDDYVNIGEWDKIIKIELPPLTVHEQLEIRQYGNNEDDANKIEEIMGINSDELKRYWKFARYYPNYQPVTL